MSDAPTIEKVRVRSRAQRREIDAKLRARIEATVERMISALDAFDALTEDLEETDEDGPGEDDEPSLGSQERHPARSPWGFVGYDSRDNQGDQTFWANGNRGGDDREGDEHDGREPDVDDEPSLGASEPIEPEPGRKDYWGGQLVPVQYTAFDQSWWTHGSNASDLEADAGSEPEGDDEREHDEAEDGIADRDAMQDPSLMPMRDASFGERATVTAAALLVRRANRLKRRKAAITSDNVPSRTQTGEQE
jgi:hypothetical protein